MPNLDAMTQAAEDALRQVLELRSDESVLVVGDESAGACPDAFLAAARRIGCDADLFRLPEEARPLTQIPDDMEALLQGRDVVINAIAGRSDEVPFRIAWIKAIEDLNLKLGHSPGIVDAMMEGGAMDVDYAAMRTGAEQLIAGFERAASVHITTDAGTDLTVGLRGRPFVSDVHITATEKGVNLPCGEVYCCPVETEADGMLVVDGCFGMEGNVHAPVRIVCREGQAVEVSCDDDTLTTRINALLDTDAGSRTIAELGIGLNPGARLIGNMLEDEKALRTAHIAFGSNMGMPGGRSESSMHMDYLFHRPTMTVTRVDGSEVLVMEGGELT